MSNLAEPPVLQDLDFLARRYDFLVGQAVRLSPPAVAGVWLRLCCSVGRDQRPSHAIIEPRPFIILSTGGAANQMEQVYTVNENDGSTALMTPFLCTDEDKELQ